MNAAIDLFDWQRPCLDAAREQEFFLNYSALGSGKTVISFAEVAEATIGRVLIVTLNSAKSVWEDHAQRFFPDLPCVVVPSKTTPAKRQAALDEFFSHDRGFLIVHWDVVGNRFVDPETGRPRSRDNGGVERPLIPELQATRWDWVIADECHAIKERRTMRRRGFVRVKAARRRALTGTPIVNRPDEAWGILNWLDPKTYSSFWRFFERHVNYTTDVFGYRHVIGPKDPEAFRAEIAPFSYRIPKSAVTTETPLYTHARVEMAPAQRRAYREMRDEMLAWIGEEPDTEPLPAPTALARLTRLRQFATAYAEYDHDTGKVRLSEPSPKLDAMIEILQGTDEQVVVFTQFRQLLDLALKRLEDAGISYVAVHGGVGDADRAAAVEKFQSGGAQVFIATMGTAGTGLTLTAAETMIFLDRSWSPAQNDQAEGRAFGRANDAHGLNVIIIESVGTVDRVVENRLDLKRSWFRSMFEEE